MKTPIAFTVAMVAFASPHNGVAADAAANWNQHCAPCHGKDGKGDTTMGKKLGVKNYHDPKFQAAFSDAEMERAIKEGVKTNGKETMKPFRNKLSDVDIKALVTYIRSFKK
jgi:cytochrome c553